MLDLKNLLAKILQEIKNIKDSAESITYNSSSKQLQKTVNGNTSTLMSATDFAIQSNWNETTTTSASYIQNKPTIPIVDATLSDSSTNTIQNKVVKQALDNKVDKDGTKVLSTNDYTTTEKNKLSGIAAGAEVNQNAFSNIIVGSSTIEADSKIDTLELEAGSNITLTPDITNDKITISATDTTYAPSTVSTDGLMTADQYQHLAAAYRCHTLSYPSTVSVPARTWTPIFNTSPDSPGLQYHFYLPANTTGNTIFYVVTILAIFQGGTTVNSLQGIRATCGGTVFGTKYWRVPYTNDALHEYTFYYIKPSDPDDTPTACKIQVYSEEATTIKRHDYMYVASVN